MFRILKPQNAKHVAYVPDAARQAMKDTSAFRRAAIVITFDEAYNCMRVIAVAARQIQRIAIRPDSQRAQQFLARR